MALYRTLGLLIVLLGSGCAGPKPEATPEPAPSAFREFRARKMETIFSPIDLPAPTRQRLVSGAPGPEYWQQRVDYDIDATLDAEAKTLSGRATITYTNNSPDALAHVWVHLEQNLFRKESVGALKTAPGARFGNRDGFEGGLEIGHVKVSPTVSLDAGGGEVSTLEPGSDLSMQVYDTIGRIDLPVPIAPGGTFAFEIAWSFRIPQYGSDRMGWQEVADGTVFQLAQWFPAVAVYDDVYGWNTLPYLGQGEFYTNFGDYDVRLKVPRGHIVAATGELANEEEVLTAEQRSRLASARLSAETVAIRGEPEVLDPATRPEGEGPLTWRFVAEDVRTFAFASSEAFIWDAAFLEGSGPEGPDGMPTGTLVQSVYPGEGMAVWPKSTEMLRSAIEGYNTRWFRYPYPVATNVNGIVGGMEYPMIIFCAERRDERGLWGVTTHEIGHNWFPMVVSNDERRHAWMDEGFNTFINYYSNRERYPDATGGRGNAREFVASMVLPDQEPMAMPADHVQNGRLGMMQYAKPSVALVLLREQVLGPERFDAAFREYIRRWAFKSPRPADFFRCMEDVAGQGLDWFWRGWFLETGTLDQAVVSVEQEERSAGARATFANRGELVMPLRFRVSYSDGTMEDRMLPVETWFPTNRWTTGWDTGGRVVTGVVVDPDEVMPDCDLGNNVWTGPQDGGAGEQPAKQSTK
jgi:hypothetical protein